jgi:hypothetical protein
MVRKNRTGSIRVKLYRKGKKEKSYYVITLERIFGPEGLGEMFANI